jgi:histidinol phosphatase-like enzyme
MILQAQIDFDLDLPKSVLIGDKMSDIQAGAAAGIKLCIRVDPDESLALDIDPAHQVVRNLEEALSVLQSECVAHCFGNHGVV